MKSILVASLLSVVSISSFAAPVTVPVECANRVKQVTAIIPGDDGTFYKPSDVNLSNAQLLGSGIGGANGVPYSKYSMTIAVGAFSGTATVTDSAGSCYIDAYSVTAP